MFRSFFKRHSTPDAQGFRNRVLKIVKALHPNIPIESPAEYPDIIIANKIQIGLQNLRSKFDQSGRSQEDLEELVRNHFGFVLQDEPDDLDFSIAAPKLRPQLMPPEYTQQAPIISFPFGRSLAVGIVLDSDMGYSYVRIKDALRWNKSHKELLDISIANLNEGSHNMQMQSADGKEAKWIGIEAKDGFDAVRILIPKLREFLASRLGDPFRFAVPNRDFLICWNIDATERFLDFVRSKIKKDFTTQPYPLSPHIFEATVEGTITERD